jgi:hypothetical protein
MNEIKMYWNFKWNLTMGSLGPVGVSGHADGYVVLAGQHVTSYACLLLRVLNITQPSWTTHRVVSRRLLPKDSLSAEDIFT